MKASLKFRRKVECELKRLREQKYPRSMRRGTVPGPSAQNLVGMASEIEQEIRSIRASMKNLSHINGVLNRVGTQQTKIVADMIMRDAIRPLQKAADDLVSPAKQLKKEGIRRRQMS